MGGGGGSRGVPDRVRQVLEEKVKRTLSDADDSRRNVFISFAFDDINEVRMLRGQAMNQNAELDFSDRSVKEAIPTTRDALIENAIREKIRQASVTVCFLTPNAAKSDWVDWEIRESIAMGKGVVCMYPGDRPPRTLPPAVREHNIPLVPWKHDRLMTAIDEAASSRSGGR